MIPDELTNVTPISQVTDVTQVSNVSNISNTSNIEPVTQKIPVEVQQKRVYVNIKLDNYLYAKKKTGNALATLQDYFDSLIEYDRSHTIIKYKEN